MKWETVDNAPEEEWVLIHYSKSITDKEPSWVWDINDSRTYVALLRGGIWYAQEGFDILSPTHWMLLPEPPEE